MLSTEVQTLLGYRHVSGSWLQDIHWALLWRARGRAVIFQLFVALLWSWPSISEKPTKIKNAYDKCERHDFPIYGRSAQKQASPKKLDAVALVETENVVDIPFL